jgi:hypothetical protein
VLARRVQVDDLAIGAVHGERNPRVKNRPRGHVGQRDAHVLAGPGRGHVGQRQFT